MIRKGHALPGSYPHGERYIYDDSGEGHGDELIKFGAF